MAGRFSSRRGFTLIELLVVVAIIAVLAALLFASLGSIRGFAQRVQCSSRLHHLNAAMQLYAEDNNGTFPGLVSPTYHNPEGIWFSYGALLLPYLEITLTPSQIASGNYSQATKNIFSCPLEKNDVNHPSYLFNSGNQYDASFPGLAGTHLAAVKHPSRTILLFELCAIFPTSWHEPRVAPNGIFNNAKSIVSFVDGHVAWLPIYWSGSGLSVTSDPPVNYDYQWSNE